MAHATVPHPINHLITHLPPDPEECGIPACPTLPQQVWTHLTPEQQHRVLRTIVLACHTLLPIPPTRAAAEEDSHEPC